MDDITVLDTVVPEEFASELFKLADRHARSANWDLAGTLHTAGQVIDALVGRIYELEETVDGRENQSNRRA